MLHTHRDLCWLPPQRFKCMPRSREKGMKVGSWSQFLKTLPRKSRFHKGAGSRINAELLFGATGCPALLLWGWGVCYWRQGKQLSWSFIGYSVLLWKWRTLSSQFRQVPARGQHLWVWWVITGPELEARYLTWLQRPTQKPTWNQIFLKSTGLRHTQCTNELFKHTTQNCNRLTLSWNSLKREKKLMGKQSLPGYLLLTCQITGSET